MLSDHVPSERLSSPAERDVFSPGMPIVLVGPVAMAGVSSVFQSDRTRMHEFFSELFLNGLQEKVQVFVSTEAERSRKVESICEAIGGSAYVCPVGKDGLYAALWTIWERTGRGFIVHMDEIPLCQYVIEVCEWLVEDPCAMDSTGCLLCVGYDVERLRAMSRTPLSIVRIGTLTADKAKKLIRQDRVRFLDKPR